MIALHSLLLYCGIYAVAIATPGPGIFAIIARALGGGFRSTIPAVLGNTLGDLILMSLSALGLAMVARQMGGLFLAVKLAGRRGDDQEPGPVGDDDVARRVHGGAAGQSER